MKVQPINLIEKEHSKRCNTICFCTTWNASTAVQVVVQASTCAVGIQMRCMFGSAWESIANRIDSMLQTRRIVNVYFFGKLRDSLPPSTKRFYFIVSVFSSERLSWHNRAICAPIKWHFYASQSCQSENFTRWQKLALPTRPTIYYTFPIQCHCSWRNFFSIISAHTREYITDFNFSAIYYNGWLFVCFVVKMLCDLCVALPWQMSHRTKTTAKTFKREKS